MATAHGVSTESRRELATTINRIAILLDDTGKSAEAEAEHRKARAIPQKLADNSPAVTDFRSDLACSHDNLGILLMHTGKLSEAEVETRKGLALQQKLADENADVPKFQLGLARSLLGIGWQLRRPEKRTRRSDTIRGKR